MERTQSRAAVGSVFHLASGVTPVSTLREVGLFGFVALAWGGSYVAIKAGLDALPPLFFAAARLDIAAAIVLPAAFLFTDEWLPDSRDDYLDVLVSGVLVTAAANAFLFLGQQYATSAVGAVLFSLNPILAAGFAWPLLADERLDELDAVGLGVGILGVGVITRPSPSAFLSGSAGQLILVLGAACLALGSVLSRCVDSSMPSLSVAGWGFVLGGVLLHLASAAVGRPAPLPDGSRSHAALLVAVGYLGLVATAGAYPAYYSLLKRTGAIRANLVSYVVPAVAALAGWAVLGQAIALSTVAGFLVIAGGFAVVNREAVAAMIGDVAAAD